MYNDYSFSGLSGEWQGTKLFRMCKKYDLSIDLQKLKNL